MYQNHCGIPNHPLHNYLFNIFRLTTKKISNLPFFFLFFFFFWGGGGVGGVVYCSPMGQDSESVSMSLRHCVCVCGGGGLSMHRAIQLR